MLRNEDHDVDELVFVDVVEFVQEPEGVVFRIPCVARIKWLESSDFFDRERGDSREMRVYLGVELALSFEDRELMLAESRGVAGQLEDHVIEGGSQVVNEIPQQERPLIVGPDLDDLDDVLAGYRVRLTNESVQIIRVNEVVQPLKMHLRSIELERVAGTRDQLRHGRILRPACSVVV
jgi:hypothetical protein